FEGCGAEPPRVAVLNTDDPHGQALAKLSKKKGSVVITYGLSAGDFHAKDVQVTSRGTRFQLITPSVSIELWSPLIGKVNVYNVMAAAAAAFGRSCSAEA